MDCNSSSVLSSLSSFMYLRLPANVTAACLRCDIGISPSSNNHFTNRIFFRL